MTTKSSNTNGEHGNLWGPSGFSTLMGMNIPPAALMTEMNGHLYKGIAAFNRDWVGFVNRCLKDNLELSQGLAACNTADEMRRVYGDWYQRSAEHYLDGLVEMANNSKSLVHDSMTAVQNLAAKAVPTAESQR